jgi:CRISPR/Cas system-associated endonuclease/helicase Cas3
MKRDKKLNVVPLISETWNSIEAEFTISERGVYSFRSHQKTGFELLKDERFGIWNAPMGSGKSYGACALALYNLEKDYKKKVIMI